MRSSRNVIASVTWRLPLITVSREARFIELGNGASSVGAPVAAPKKFPEEEEDTQVIPLKNEKVEQGSNEEASDNVEPEESDEDDFVAPGVPLKEHDHESLRVQWKVQPIIARPCKIRVGRR